MLLKDLTLEFPNWKGLKLSQIIKTVLVVIVKEGILEKTLYFLNDKITRAEVRSVASRGHEPKDRIQN